MAKRLAIKVHFNDEARPRWAWRQAGSMGTSTSLRGAALFRPGDPGLDGLFSDCETQWGREADVSIEEVDATDVLREQLERAQARVDALCGELER